MARYAIIDTNNVVVNIIDYEQAPTNPPPGFPETYIAVETDTAQIDWLYENKMFINPNPLPPYIATAEENKRIASQFLYETDWATIPDVSDPTKSQPYLTNADEFISYRNQVRQYAIFPTEGVIVFPTKPKAIWSS